jgi:recombination protein RecR
VKRTAYPAPVQQLIGQLKRLPGIGPRSAERIALWLMQTRDSRPGEIAEALRAVAEQVRLCERCGFFSVEPQCEICRDPARSTETLCVVEQATDILPIERTGAMRGLYHALGGRISPLDHISPDDLRIGQLLQRIETEKPTEVILALSGDVEGEATANYLAGLLRGRELKVTRIAMGLPAGGGLESADELTLSCALTGRREL